MDTALKALAVLVAVGSYAAGIAAGLSLARRVRISAPPGIREGTLAARSFRLWIWCIRAFVFLVVLLMISWPVGLLLEAVM